MFYELRRIFRDVHWLLIYHILFYSWLASTLNAKSRNMQKRQQAIVFLIEGFTDIIVTKQPWNDNTYMAKELRAFIILHPWVNADLHFLCQLMLCKDRIQFNALQIFIGFLKQNNIRDKLTLKNHHIKRITIKLREFARMILQLLV